MVAHIGRRRYSESDYVPGCPHGVPRLLVSSRVMQWPDSMQKKVPGPPSWEFYAVRPLNAGAPANAYAARHAKAVIRRRRYRPIIMTLANMSVRLETCGVALLVASSRLMMHSGAALPRGPSAAVVHDARSGRRAIDRSSALWRGMLISSGHVHRTGAPSPSRSRSIAQAGNGVEGAATIRTYPTRWANGARYSVLRI